MNTSNTAQNLHQFSLSVFLVHNGSEARITVEDHLLMESWYPSEAQFRRTLDELDNSNIDLDASKIKLYWHQSNDECRLYICVDSHAAAARKNIALLLNGIGGDNTVWHRPKTVRLVKG